jgi:hypothetical protein
MVLPNKYEHIREKATSCLEKALSLSTTMLHQLDLKQNTSPPKLQLRQHIASASQVPDILEARMHET